MATIINNTDTTLSIEAQQAVRNGAANCGTSKVEAVRTASYDEGESFDIYDAQDPDEENYLFSVSNPDGVIYER